jgi:Peptidase family M23
MTPRHRPTARGILLSCVLLFAVGAEAAWAQPTAAAGAETAAVPRLVFPLLGAATFTDDFGDARGQGTHEGIDIVAPRRAPVLAVEAGTVKFWTTSSRAGCMLYLHGESGTTYLYIHLNNDLCDENDNRGTCVPGIAYVKGLRNGAKVAAGEMIAFNGDSGDADGIHPHLHFEVHPGGSGLANPYKHLLRARRLLFAAERGSTFTLALTGRVAGAVGQDLSLQLDQVRQWPGGRKVAQSGQKVAVAVPETAILEGADTPAPGPFALELLPAGRTVTVWTQPAKVTFAAQTGAKGALAAERVVIKR